MIVGAGAAVAAGIAIGAYWGSHNSSQPAATQASSSESGLTVTSTPGKDDKVDLNEAQVKAIELGTAGTRSFINRRTAVGSIDFNENLEVPVFSNYQGKILKTFVEVGQTVTKGQALYTIDSPDLVQAESALIAAAGVYELTTAALARAKPLLEVQGIAQKDLDQAISDQQTADAALKAAKEAVRVYGKTEAEINGIVAHRKIDPSLVVPSPINGRITTRNAQPGLLVQPGSAPAPYTVSDVSSVWLLANVAETDSPLFHVGQSVKVKVNAFPDRVFEGRISVLGESVDPATHTLVVRSELRDPKHELRSGMLATYDIRTKESMISLTVPLDSVVREGDGSMSVWVTTDKKRFLKRTVKLGVTQDGFHQVLEGLKAGETVVTKGAILLSNIANGNADS